MLSVFIFGAGASFEAGAPLMNDFIEKSEKLYRRSKTELKENEITDFNHIFESIDILSSLYSKTHLDITNVETLFCLIEMANSIELTDNNRLEEIVDIRDSLVNVIIKTIEKNMYFDNTNNKIHVAAPYDRLLLELNNLTKNNEIEHEFGFISFNYDIGIESAILNSSLYDDILYQLMLDKPKRTADVLKLHGSINWGYCDSCEKLHVYDCIKIFGSNAMFSGTYNMEVSKYFEDQKCEECGGRLKKYIIPPTWNKIIENEIIYGIWGKAVSLLNQSTNIFVIGYSMPETDLFFKYLITLGLFENNSLRKFVVINPDDIVNSKYKNILSRGVIENNYKFLPQKFSDSIFDITEILRSY